jgi:hypothetical protein
MATHRENRRGTVDRRKEATTVWNSLVGWGHRMHHRRGVDRQQPYFVDRFSAWLFTLIVLILVMSMVDALITLMLLDYGYHEGNPPMAYLLDWGVEAFLVGKLALTAAGLPLLLVLKNYTLFRTRVRVGAIFVLFVLLYVALLGYQCTLLYGCYANL